jgi:hypothetical protein
MGSVTTIIALRYAVTFAAVPLLECRSRSSILCRARMSIGLAGTQPRITTPKHEFGLTFGND